jgi:hypothetical protein
MKTTPFALLICLAAFMQAPAQTAELQAARPANTQISVLPFDITAPGTYVLTGNLTNSAAGVSAINISTALTGPVVLDLSGFTITANSAPAFSPLINIGLLDQHVANTQPITIRNGTLNTLGADAVHADENFVNLSDITVDKVVINGGTAGFGIFFNHVTFSTISNCTFNGNMGIAIFDRAGSVGNSYLNDTFSGPIVTIRIAESDVTLSRASFSSPSATTTTTTAGLTAPGRTVISALPFNITAPGTYVLNGNLDASTGGINILTALAGPVILDLRGFTISGNHQNSTPAVNIGLTPTVANTFPITVRNGTIQNSPTGLAASANGTFFSNLTIDRIDFIKSFVFLGRVNSSTVSRCTFDGSEVTDANSIGGNRYTNDVILFPAVFVVSSPVLSTQGTPIVMDRCIFAPNSP